MKKESNGNKRRKARKKQLISDELFKRIVGIIIFLLGLGIFLYPNISNYLMVRSQTLVINSYEKKIEEIPKKEKEELRKKINAYNEKQSGYKIKNNEKATTDSDTTQDSSLDEEANAVFDVMKALLGDEVATVDIPKIHVTVPVYQGTTEEILQKGVGLLEGTAIPLGGKGSHAVITGHSGLPSAKIFTDLPKLELGDVFYIQSFDEKLAYEVDQMLTVEPDETEALRPDPDQDYTTLITCVPYAVNTHRLFVRGHRIPYEEKQKETVGKKAQSSYKKERLKWYLVFAAAVLLVLYIYARLRRQEIIRLNR